MSDIYPPPRHRAPPETTPTTRTGAVPEASSGGGGGGAALRAQRRSGEGGAGGSAKELENASDSAARIASSGGRGSSSGGQGSSGSLKVSGRVRTGERGFRFIDNYGLLVCLGEGGMGEVWAARDPAAPKNLIVALKTTKQQGAEAARVLWDEARIASLIEHPNVCRVRELGRDGDMQYLVMDYCDGGSLHDLLERSPGRTLSYGLAARIIAHVCAGLHAAHELLDESGQYLGVVHRDVSPQNVLISTSGQVTVTDFGVAKALGQAHKATETGEMKGKLSYMAPEQVTSRDIDRRVDVFALGCVLYQITVGRRPFHGDDALATLYQLLEKEIVAPRQLRSDYPEELEQIVLKALKKERSERFATAEEMQRALELFLMGAGQLLSESDIAAAVAEALGETIAKRKDEIRERMRALDAGEQLELERESVRVSTGPAGEGVDTSAGTVTDRPPEGRKPSSWWAAAAVFLVIGLGTMVALRQAGVGVGEDASARASAPGSEGRADAPEPSSPKNGATGVLTPLALEKSAPAAVQGTSASGLPAGALADPEGRQPELEPVRLRIKTVPSSVTIRVDGREVGVGSYQAEVDRSTEGHILELSAPGYDTLTRALVFDRSQDLELSLTRRRAESAAPPGASTASSKTPAGSKTTKKPPRSLDSENPFAVPQ